jgi:hypothetical protein
MSVFLTQIVRETFFFLKSLRINQSRPFQVFSLICLSCLILHGGACQIIKFGPERKKEKRRKEAERGGKRRKEAERGGKRRKEGEKKGEKRRERLLHLLFCLVVCLVLLIAQIFSVAIDNEYTHKLL